MLFLNIPKGFKFVQYKIVNQIPIAISLDVFLTIPSTMIFEVQFLTFSYLSNILTYLVLFLNSPKSVITWIVCGIWPFLSYQVLRKKQHHDAYKQDFLAFLWKTHSQKVKYEIVNHNQDQFLWMYQYPADFAALAVSRAEVHLGRMDWRV